MKRPGVATARGVEVMNRQGVARVPGTPSGNRDGVSSRRGARDSTGNVVNAEILAVVNRRL